MYPADVRRNSRLC